MNWDSITAIAQLLGAIGVIVTLGYLAVQIKQNTTMMRATVKQEQTVATQNVLFKWAEYPNLWSELSSEVPLSKEDETRAQILLRASFRGFESHCHQHEVGLLDEQEWVALQETIRTFAALPRVSEYYLRMRDLHSARLQELVDPIVKRKRGNTSEEN